MKVLICRNPFPHHQPRGTWPCHWVNCATAGTPPFVTAYRRQFTLTRAAKVRIHVSADERYELFLDSRRIGRGPERGDSMHWFYESYDLQLTAGSHLLVARVWSFGALAPYAQMTDRPAFVLAAEGRFGKSLSTGIAAWEAKRLDGYQFHSSHDRRGPNFTAIGPDEEVDASRFAWGFEHGAGAGWQPVTIRSRAASESDDYGNRGHGDRLATAPLLCPATLPAMLEKRCHTGTVRFVGEQLSGPVRARNGLTGERRGWQRLADGRGAVTVPARTTRRVIVDLANYFCAYPELVTTGGRGSVIELAWAESLFADAEGKTYPDGQSKGDRNAVDGRHFIGRGDIFRPDGGARRKFATLWWRAGRYVQFAVTTAAEPLTIAGLTLWETRYPMEAESAFHCDDHRLEKAQPVMVRALQMCSHETYMDCPYYEQLMYVGDSRLEALTTYAIMRDDCLPRKSVWMFDASRQAGGFTQSRYPSQPPQVIPPFSLWWIGMVYDYARWRDDAAFVRARLPGVRAVLDAFLSYRNDRGLLTAPPGWNFLDWVPAWRGGNPPDVYRGGNASHNWQLVIALAQAAEMEAWLEEPELAARDHRLIREIVPQIDRAFWDEKRGLYAEDAPHKCFAEHAQCLALLSGQLDADRQARVGRGLLRESDLVRTTIYFTHYLFEAYRTIDRPEALFQRLKLWFDLLPQGFTTTPETPEPSRSDCHAWGAHPLYHYHATLAGIRPAAFGFQQVEIRPQLGALQQLRSRLPHPRGWIEMDLKHTGRGWRAKVSLPRGVTGRFVWKGREIPFRGRQLIKLSG
jgi:alpha-L-rhamnosidase